MRSSRSLGDLKGSLLKGSERVRKHSTGEPQRRKSHRKCKVTSESDRREMASRLYQELLRPNFSEWAAKSCRCQRFLVHLLRGLRGGLSVSIYNSEWCHSHRNVNGEMRDVLCLRGKMQIGGERDSWCQVGGRANHNDKPHYYHFKTIYATDIMTKLLNSASTKSQEPFILNRHWKWHVIKEY